MSIFLIFRINVNNLFLEENKDNKIVTTHYKYWEGLESKLWIVFLSI